MPAYTGGMSNDMNRPGTYRPRHLAPSLYPSVRQGWGEARPSATRVLTTLLVGLFLLCGIYQFAAAGLGPVRHQHEGGAHPAQEQAQSAPSSRQDDAQQPEQPLPLLDPSVGRGAASPTCKHAARSPRCRMEGGSGLSVPTNRSPQAAGLALAPATDDGQTLLLDRAQGGEETFGPTHPQRMPGRVPGRGGWVSEQGPSRA